jgi:hypothetical protein
MLTKASKTARPARRIGPGAAVFIVTALASCLALPWLWTSADRAAMARLDVHTVAWEMRTWANMHCVVGSYSLVLMLLFYLVGKIRHMRPPALPAGFAWLIWIMAPQVIAAVFHRQLYASWQDGGDAEPIPRPIFDALRWAWWLFILAYVGCVLWSFTWGEGGRRWMHAQRAALGVCCCEQCGYNLTGNVTGVCPECGTPVPPGPSPAGTDGQ